MSNAASRRPDRDTVLFVSIWSLLGGGQKSLLTLLAAMPDDITCVLAAPSEGPLIERVRVSTRVRDHVAIPDQGSDHRWRRRISGTAILGWWLIRNHRRVRAVHVNGDAELKMLLPVVLMTRAKVVVWYHSKQMSRSTARLAPLTHLLRRRLVWAAVSEDARRALLSAGVASARNAVVVPNPIDAGDVVPRARTRSDSTVHVIGYLGCEETSKGILFLPDIAERLQGMPVRLLVVTKAWPRDRNPDNVNTALDRLRQLAPQVVFRQRDHDVRNIYAEIDALLVPSLSESFCRIAAEAMLNRLPVVASDLPALRELVGADEAGLLFPTGDADAAAAAVEAVIADDALRTRITQAGHDRAARLAPERVAAQLIELYGFERTPDPTGSSGSR
jgi:phosphatidylinositol alpha-mannosyltransferase